MARKQISRFRAYNEKRNTRPSGQTGAISARNNNVSDEPSYRQPNVEAANDTGIGDSGINRNKLTSYTSNHSADA